MDKIDFSAPATLVPVAIDDTKPQKFRAMNDTVLLQEYQEKIDNPCYHSLLSSLDSSDFTNTVIKVAIWVTLGLPLLVAAFIDYVNSPSFDVKKEKTLASVGKDCSTRWSFIQIDKKLCDKDPKTIADNRLSLLKQKYLFLKKHYNTSSKLEKRLTRMEAAIGTGFQEDLRQLEKSVSKLPTIDYNSTEFEEVANQMRRGKEELQDLESSFSELEKTIDEAFLSLNNADYNNSSDDPSLLESIKKLKNEFNNIDKKDQQQIIKQKTDALYHEVLTKFDNNHEQALQFMNLFHGELHSDLREEIATQFPDTLELTSLIQWKTTSTFLELEKKTVTYIMSGTIEDTTECTVDPLGCGVFTSKAKVQLLATVHFDTKSIDRHFTITPI